jgi:hypothetical protein
MASSKSTVNTAKLRPITTPDPAICQISFTDFGISRWYDLDEGPPLENPILGGDKTVPEFQVLLDAM